MNLTKEIQKLVGIMCLDRGHNFVIENITLAHTLTHICSKEVDVLSINNSGAVFEFEVKISKSDYYADLKKFKHDYFKSGKDNCPNYFSYVCPKDLISIDELPEYAGLYYYDKEIVEIKRPRKLTSYQHDISKLKDKFVKVMSERWFYGEARLTRLNRINKENYYKHIQKENQRLRDEVFKLNQQNNTNQ